VTVRGFDPRVAAPERVQQASDDADACSGAEIVLSVNSAADAVEALEQSLSSCSRGIVWADLNTAAPRRKQEISEVARDAVRVVDVALMAPVPGRGLATPMIVSGPGAGDYARALRLLGATIDIVAGPVGAAATRKLLRSVFYKGMSAAVLEAVEAARSAGLEDWLQDNIRNEFDNADAATFDRMMHGSWVHAVRRTEEMAAAAELLDELGVPSRVARASRDWLADLAARPRE
jgi:3-hydroxyisobutyrate dehydrogenase-like beta-hydroxyacid dehydrogenase